MKAIRYTDYQTFPKLVDVDKPVAGPGEVVLKVAASGACHSDVAVFNDFVEGTNPLCAPAFTLGHEVAGWAAEVGYLGSVGRDYGWQWYKEQYEAELVKTYWGTLPELLDGQVSGRAIIVP